MGHRERIPRVAGRCMAGTGHLQGLQCILKKKN